VTTPACRRFLRERDEMFALSGDALLSEPRFNPDGTIDVFRWSRPQYDGPALRALACMQYIRAGGAESAELTKLLQHDLAFTLRQAGKPCVGPWEEPEANAHHYYVALAQLGAIVHGRAWLGDVAGEASHAEHILRSRLEDHWSERDQVYMAIWPARTADAENLVDASIVLAVLDADLPEGPHNVADLRIQKTLNVIAAAFARALPINKTRSAGRAPMLGRYLGDKYFGGGAWYVTTLAAAEFHYRLALFPGQDCAALMDRGDEFMTAVRAFTPDSGELSEQIDRDTGLQRSASRLTWSHAAFVSAALRRSQAAVHNRGSAQVASDY
jgi:glucoamylase